MRVLIYACRKKLGKAKLAVDIAGPERTIFV